jgi:uncharacterized protein YgiM (DUF1202 family)
MHTVLWAALLAVACAGLALAAGKTLSVAIRDAQLRETPSFLGKILGPVRYAQQVEVIEEKGDWDKVAAPGGNTGWLHISALSDKKIALASGALDAGRDVSGKEMALAGKGFNAQVEGEYRQGHAANYDWIDKMGKISYPPEALAAFLAQGGLVPREEGAQ